MRRYLPYIALGILLIASVYQWAENENLVIDIATEKQKVVDGETRIREKEGTIGNLKNSNVKLKDSIDLLNFEIRKSKNVLAEIQKQRYEKIRIIDRLTLSELQEYFTKRYADKPAGSPR